jgi:hypothetical protein
LGNPEKKPRKARKNRENSKKAWESQEKAK